MNDPKGRTENGGRRESWLIGLALVGVVLFVVVVSLLQSRTEGLADAAAMSSDGGDYASAWVKDGDVRDEVRAALEDTHDYRILFNTPRSLDYEKATRLRALVVSGDADAARREMLGLAGPVEETTAPLTMMVTARLEGPEEVVSISPPNDQYETIVDGQNTFFDWGVRPTGADAFWLTLTLTNVAVVDGQPYPKKLPQVKRRFLVNASAWQKFTIFMKTLDPLDMLMGLVLGIGALLGGLWAKRKWFTS